MNAPTPAQPAATWSVIDRAQAGGPDAAAAFAELYARYRPWVFTYIRRKVHLPELAEDLTGDTFVRALRHIGTVEWQGRDPSAWLITIARNLVADHYKSARVRLAANTELEWWRDDDPVYTRPDPRPGPADLAAATEVRTVLLAAIRQLPPKQRRVIELRYLRDLSVEETCARTGWTEGVVKALTYRAVRRLARTLPREALAA